MDDPSSPSLSSLSSSSTVSTSTPAKSSEKLLSANETGIAEHGYPPNGSVDSQNDDGPPASDTDESDNGCCPTSRNGNGKKRDSDEGCSNGCVDRSASCCCCGTGGILSSCDYYWPRRYTVVVLLFIGMCIVNSMRVNIGVAVVQVLDAETSIHSRASPAAQMANEQLSKLQWSSTMVGVLHSIFYVGILISQIPCAYVLNKFKLPSHSLFGGCILLSHVLNFLIPLGVTTSYAFVLVIRLFQGLVEGMLYPSCYDVMRHWTMPEERSRVGATVMTGAYIGPTMGTIMSGLLYAYAGWMYIFYYHGALGIVWYALWVFFVYERPSTHPTISADECKTIETKLGEAALIYEHDSIPWKAIFTSLPVYGLIFCNFARSFVFYMMLTNGPAFLNVFRFTYVENGLFLALPYAFMAVFSLASGLVADLMILKRGRTTTFVRKTFTCVGFGLSAIFFFALAIVVERFAAVVVMTLAVGLGGIAIAGWQINHLDLAPRYASVLVAITMTVGTLAGTVNPLLVAVITRHQELYEWHMVFWLTGLVLTFSLVFYGVFGSGERQSWSVPSPPTVRIVTRADPLQARPYGTFSAQVKYDSGHSTVTFPGKAAATDVVIEPPPRYQEVMSCDGNQTGLTTSSTAADKTDVNGVDEGDRSSDHEQLAGEEDVEENERLSTTDVRRVET